MDAVGPEIRPNANRDDRNYNGVHPLRLDLVLQRVFSFSALQDLLASRSVCRVWGLVATQEVRSRKEVVARIRGNEDDDEDKDVRAYMTDFIQVMTPALQSEAGIPLTRIDLSLDLLLVSLPTKDLLRFIAPWVQGILLHWLPSDPRSSSNQISQVIRALERGLEGITFPALRELDVGNDLDSQQPQGLDFAATILVKGLLSAAKGLTRYDHATRFANDDSRQEMLLSHVIGSLPPSLKTLAFGQDSSVDFAVLSNCNFHLEGYFHSFDRETLSSIFPNDVLAFLLRQAGTLRNLQMRFLEHLYHNVYPAFPIFPLVTRLQMNVSHRSRLEWIAKFPALHHLELHLRYSDGSIDPPEMTNPEDIRRLSQHQGVRSLGIRPFRGAVMLRFDILSQVFPNVRVLDLSASGCLEGEVAHLCTHMTGLEVLKLTWELHRGGGAVPLVHPDLEAILCGLPLSVEKGEHLFDFPLFGLANLKKLKRLEVSGASVHFELFLTPLTLFHAFRRMGELKEIQLNELHPQAVEVVADIIKVLRVDGIEVNESVPDD